MCVWGGGGVPVYHKLTGGCIVGLLHVIVCVCGEVLCIRNWWMHCGFVTCDCVWGGGEGGVPVYQTGGCIVGLLHAIVCVCGGGGGVPVYHKLTGGCIVGLLHAIVCVCVGGGVFLCIIN